MTTASDIAKKPFAIQEVVDILRGLNGTRKKVLSGIENNLGESECLMHISFSNPKTTIMDVVKDGHPLTPCKNCNAYELMDYDCPNYRSTALYTLRKGLNQHVNHHPQDIIFPIMILIQQKFPETYKF